MTRIPSLAAAAAGLAALFLAGAVGAQAPATRPAAKAAAPNAQAVPAEIDAAFTAWDADRNGMLSLQEFRNGWIMLRRAGQAQARLRAQFDAIDANKNDAIDANEYSNLVLVKRAGKSAPLLAAFDANKNQRLEFPEYLAFIRRMEASQPAVKAPAPVKAP